jgi:hypothetical protein
VRVVGLQLRAGHGRDHLLAGLRRRVVRAELVRVQGRQRLRQDQPGCCPCNAGGQEVPAHKDCIDQVMKCDIPPDQVNCPQVFLCTDAQPACVNGACVLK